MHIKKTNDVPLERLQLCKFENIAQHCWRFAPSFFPSQIYVPTECVGFRLHTVMLQRRQSPAHPMHECVCLCVCVCVMLLEAGDDGSSQLTGEHICLGRAIMQDLGPCQPAAKQERECVCVCLS